MDRNCLARHTVDEDPEAIPGSQIWIDGSGQIWHDLHGVHARMFAREVVKEWQEWREDFMACMRRMGVPPERYHLSGQDPGKVWNVADSFAVLCDIWGAAELSRVPAWAAGSLNVLVALQNRIDVSLAPAQRVSIPSEADTHFLVHGNRIQGWSAWYSGRPKKTREAWSRIWERMPECAPHAITDDVQRIATIIHFALQFRRVRIGANGKISRVTHRVMMALQHGLLEFLADRLDRYLHTVYLPLRPRPKPPPARVSPKKNKGQDEVGEQGPCTSAGRRARVGEQGPCTSVGRRAWSCVMVDPEAM